MSFCYFRVKEAYAIDYEFETGFEESDPFAEWTPDPVFGYGYEIQTTIVHAGVNACRSDSTSGGMLYELSSEYTSHYSLVYFYINGTVPDEFGGSIFIRIWDVEITVYIETNASRGAGKSPYIRFYDQMDDDFSVLDSQGLTLGAWHSVGIYTEGDSGSANHKCWVDGRLIASEIDDTSGFNITGVDVYNVHWTGDYDGRVFIDDFASDDDVPMYYFNFDFKDLDSNDVQDHVDWALWNSTHDLGYTEGESSLENGTYYLKTTKYGDLINTTTLDTGTYGNSTIDINLNMKRHQSCADGYIVSNDTISTISIDTQSPQLLNFTIDGTTPAQLGIGVPKNASYIVEYGSGLDGWSYRKSHIINAQAEAGSNYPVKIIAHYGDGTDYNDNTKIPCEGHLYLDSKSRTDFGDIRFRDNDEETELAYWIQNKTDSDHAVFWVKLIDDLSSDVTIYIYYGKAETTYNGNGPDVFSILFDDFDDQTVGNSPEDWTDGDSLGYYKVRDDQYVTYDKSLRAEIVSGGKIIKKNLGATQSGLFVMEYSIRQDSLNQDFGFKTRSTDEVQATFVKFDGAGGLYYCLSSGDVKIMDVNADQWYRIQLIINIANQVYDIYVDGNLEKDDAPFWGDQADDIAKIELITIGSGYRWADNIFDRKYVDPEPTHGAWGQEETEGGQNMTGWVYVASPCHIHFNVTSFSTYALIFNATTEPTVGPHGPTNHRVQVDVTLHGDPVKGVNVSMEGKGFRWGLTDLFGRCIFKVKTGTYHIRASYSGYVQTRTVYISRNINIPIELGVEIETTREEDFLKWIGLPEIDFTSYGFWVLILPLILLVIYAIKRALEGPKRKWKYSYLS